MNRINRRSSAVCALLAALAAVLSAAGAPVRAGAPVVPADKAALKLITPEGHTGFISSAAVSADGQLVATGSNDYTIRLWQAGSGKELRALIGHKESVTALAFSPDGRTIVSGGYDSTVRLWSVVTGQNQKTLHCPHSTVTAVAFSPDGAAFAAASGGGGGNKDATIPITLYDSATGAVRRQFLGHKKAVEALRFSSDGKTLCSASGDGTIRIWNIAADAAIRTITAGVEVRGAAFSPDGQRVVLCGPKTSVWSVSSGMRVVQIDTESRCAVFSRDGARLYTVANVFFDEAEVRSWNAATGEQEAVTGAEAAGRKVFMLAISPVGNTLYTGDTSGILRAFDLRAQQQRWASAAELRAARIRRIAVAPDGGSVYVSEAGLGAIVRRINLLTGKPVRLYAPPADSADRGKIEVNDIALSGDGKRLAVAYGSYQQPGLVRVWDTATGRKVQRFTGHTKKVEAVAITRDGSQILSGDEEGTLILWDAVTGAERMRLRTPNGSDCNAVAFSPDEKTALGASWEGPLTLWDMASGKPRRTFSAPQSEVTYSVAFSPDGTQAIAGTFSGVARLWNVETGALIRSLEHQAIAPNTSFSVYAAVWSADGKTIATGSQDGVVRLWDSVSGALLSKLNGHTNDVLAVAFAPGGAALFSASYDHTLRAWDTKKPSSARAAFTYLLLEQDGGETPPLAGSGNWLAFDASGRFDGSESARARVHFSRGLQTYTLEQFAERFYTPGLAAQIMGGAPPPREDVATADDTVLKGAPPLVRLVIAPPGSKPTVEISVEATEQASGGVKAIRLYQNGRLIGGPSGALRGVAVEAVSGATTSKHFTVTLVTGQNVFSAVAFSSTDVESLSVGATVSYAPSAPVRSTLYVLAVGINAYKDSTMNLAYARPDADAIAAFFESRGGGVGTGLWGEVKVTRLLDNDATGAAIRGGLSQIVANALPNDVVFIYLAGHGETAPPKGALEGDSADPVFFFLPAEMRQMALVERVREFGIAGSEIDTLLSKVKARKIILVYDACKSGAAITERTRGVAGEQKALETLARAQGIHILTAATGQQYAAEVKELGHGILTYALLEGLNGKAALGTDPDIYIRGLMSYVEDRVPELTRKYRGSEQYPVPFERGQNFPLVKN